MDKCWYCEEPKAEFIFEGVDNHPNFSSSSTLICSHCGFIYKAPCVDKKQFMENNKFSYYSITADFGDMEQFMARSKERALVDYGRAVDYIEYLKTKVDFSKVKKAMDIGGAEGLFSHVLKDLYPHIEVSCLEPDQKAIHAGKKLYPHVNFHFGSLEEIENFSLENIDLVTYWGGFYRTAYPHETLTDLRKVMSKGAHLAFSLPFTFDRPFLQCETPYESIDDYLGKGFILMLDESYMSGFLHRYFELKSVENIQNGPFFKQIPVFVAQNQFPDKTKETPPLETFRYEENKRHLLTYAQELTKKRLKELVANHSLQSIGIWGNTEEASILCDLAREMQIKVLYQVDPFYKGKTNCSQNREVPITTLSEIHHSQADALIIADFKNQKSICSQMTTRLHYPRRFKVFSGFKEKNYLNNRAVFYVGKERLLQKAFNFALLQE